MAERRHTSWIHATLLMAGLLMIGILLALLTDVMESHMQHARSVSRAASWQGKPVGVMQQKDALPPSEGLLHVNTLTLGHP